MKVKAFIIFTFLIYTNLSNAESSYEKYERMTNEQLETLVKNEDSKAEVILGVRIISNANGSVKELKKGINLLERASEDIPSISLDIWSYYVEKPNYQYNYPNLPEIIKWSRRAAEQSFVHASILLSLIYQFDDNYGYKNKKLAKIYFKKSYDLSNQIIMNKSSSRKVDVDLSKKYLTLMYLTGLGTKQDINKSLKYGLKQQLEEMVDEGLIEGIINESIFDKKRMSQMTDEEKKLIWLPQGGIKEYFEAIKLNE